MINNLILTGRLANDLEITDNTATAVISIPRAFKNEEGIYETDMIPVKLIGHLSDATKEYCQKGDLIAIKGRIQINKNSEIEIIADKVSFLSSRKKDEDEKDNNN